MTCATIARSDWAMSTPH